MEKDYVRGKVFLSCTDLLSQKNGYGNSPKYSDGK